MLSQYDLDLIMQKIQGGEKAYVYYVCNSYNARKVLPEENIFGTNPSYKVVKVEVSNIYNAYFEYLNYVNNPNDYHVETETCYYGTPDKHTRQYIVPNGKGIYELDISPKMPSSIYGNHKQIYYQSTGEIVDVIDESHIECRFENALSYGDCSYEEVLEAFDNNKLDWKYKKLPTNALIDGEEYSYITSNWYVLDIKGFPMTEMPLINTFIKNEYFTDLNNALSYMEQLEA